MLRFALTSAALAALAGSALADSVDLGAVRDNTLYQDAAGETSNGAGPVFFVGFTAMETLRRGLIRFDIAGAIPAGSTITAVTLTLNMSRTVSQDLDIALYRSLKDWGEGTSTTGTGQGGRGTAATPGDATWLHTFYPSQFWSAPGGTSGGASPDYAAAASSTATVGNAEQQYTWGSAPALVADVQAFLNQPASNFGWFLIADEASPEFAKRFDTRENATPANRPLLHVVFTPPGTPCYANCDASTTPPILNVLDFGCFLNRFAAADSYANCDGSTTPPVLNVLDFGCFLNRFAAGCS